MHVSVIVAMKNEMVLELKTIEVCVYTNYKTLILHEY